MTIKTTDLETPTVLIVEDNVDLATLFGIWLGQSYEVRIAHDCSTAYELLDETVDVALLDRHLPSGSGDEILDTIRDREIDCRIALVTGVEPSLDVITMGFDDYVCKPVSQDELRCTVESLIAGAKLGDLITEFYALTSKKSLVEAHCSQMERDDSEEFARLLERIEELDKELTQKVATFSETQFVREFSRLSTASIEG